MRYSTIYCVILFVINGSQGDTLSKLKNKRYIYIIIFTNNKTIA